MRLVRSRLFLAVVCFGFGAISLFAVERLVFRPVVSQPATPFAATSRMEPFLDQFFDNDLFSRPADPFEQMRKMRKHMRNDLGNFEDSVGLFDSWFKRRFGGGSAGDVTKRQDERYVYYDIAIKGLNQEKVDIKVEHGQVSISGQLENGSDKDGTHIYSNSRFHRSFPVPYGVDESRVQIDQEKDKLVIRFPRLRT